MAVAAAAAAPIPLGPVDDRHGQHGSRNLAAITRYYSVVGRAPNAMYMDFRIFEKFSVN